MEHDPPKVSRPFHFDAYDESANVRTGFLEFEEYLALLSELPDYLKPLLVIAYHVPSRMGELLNLMWAQIDFRAGQITLEARSTKGKEGRSMPIFGEMRSALEMQFSIRAEKFPNCRYVFFGDKGTCILDFRKAWASACERAGINTDGRELLFHDLRRSAARNMRRGGVDEPTVMRIGGWKTNAMFRRYSIVDSRETEAGYKMERYFESASSTILAQRPNLLEVQ